MKDISYLSKIPPPFLTELLEQAIIPVIGAGFSSNAKMASPGKKIPMWNELGELFAKAIKDDNYDGDPVKSISRYEEKHDKNSLIRKLSEFLYISESAPDTAHTKFSKLPFEMVVTTNFDNLLETSFTKNDISYFKIYNSVDYSLQQGQQKKILKIHGDFENRDTIVLTDADYNQVEKREHSLYEHILPSLFNRFTLLFIGYSLSDPDFNKILEEVRLDLKKYFRKPYALLVNRPQSCIEKFQQKGIIPITINDSSKNDNEIFAKLFEELSMYIEKERSKQVFEKNNMNFDKYLNELDQLLMNPIIPIKINTLYETLLKLLTNSFQLLKHQIVSITEIRNSFIDTLTTNHISLDNQFFLYNVIDHTIESNKTKIEKTELYILFKEKSQLYPTNLIINKYYIFESRVQFLSEWNYFANIFKRLLFEIIVNREPVVGDFLNKMYLDLENFVDSEYLPVIAISPLYNFFSSDMVNMQLENGLSIRPITNRELIKLRFFSNMGEYNMNHIENVRYVIEFKYALRNESDMHKEHVGANLYNVFESLIAALRLFQKGNVGIYSLSRIIDFDVPIVPAHTGMYAYDLGIDIGEYYVLEKDQINLFKNFWNEHGALLVQRILDGMRYPNDNLIVIKTAMENFLISYNKKNVYDEYVNLARSFTGIFLLDTETIQNAGKNVIERCVKLLEPEDILDLEEELHRIIDAYTKILSGQNPDQSNFLILKHVVKSSIIKYIESMRNGNFTHENFIHSLS